MKPFKNLLFKLSALTLVFVFVLSGCTKEKTAETTAAPAATATAAATSVVASAEPTPTELAPVTLSWYYGIGQAQPDQQAVEDEVNKYLKEKTKLNITLKMKPIDFGSYDQKMNVSIAANEDIDIVWTTAGWLLKYNENVKKGAFLALDDLLPQYAPKTFNEMMPKDFWNDVKADVDGKIYAIPNYQIAGTSWGFVFQKRFVDKYKFDITTVKSYKDLEPFLETLKKNEPDVIPLVVQGGGALDDLNLRDWHGLTYNINDPFKLINKEASPEYKAYLDLMHSWYQKQYIYQDSATVKDWNQIYQKGNVAVTIDTTFKPGMNTEMATLNAGNETVSQRISTPLFTGVNATMNAISKASKNPERALMLLELVNNDKDFYNLICYGILGTHYNIENGVYTAIKDSAYAPGIDWVFGNQFNGLVRAGQPADVFEQTKKLNETAEVSPLTGFTFNDSALSTESAAVNAVKGEYLVALQTGTVDPNVVLPKYLSALQKAGMDKIQAEQAKQLAEWVTKNGK